MNAGELSAPTARSRSSPWLWVQLLIGWLPVWALYTTLIVTAHGSSDIMHAAFNGLRAISAAAVLSLLVVRVTARFPWPHPMSPAFVVLHLLAATVYASLWVGLTSLIESALRGRLIIIAPSGVVPFLILGVLLYTMVAGVTYATAATQRAARAESLAAQAQLDALRAQLNPHFLFNALHTVVHLIPREPRQAAQAAEQIAALLRTTLERDRDVVSLGDELTFVERYLDLERIRFGERLRVNVQVDAESRAATLPSFALQTLVENAVRHAAAPRVEPTDITITAQTSDGMLRITVQDSGEGFADAPHPANGAGTGLRRLRERLVVLYGHRASLTVLASPGAGVAASLSIPHLSATDDE